MSDNTHKKWYAMMNGYATETSCGFANTWQAVAFDTEKHRNQVIKEGTGAARLPLSSEIRYCNSFDAIPAEEYGLQEESEEI